MKIWITGTSGFLGSHLKDALKSEHEINGNDSGICSSQPHYFSRADCRDFDEMKKLLVEFKPDVLVHCAATAHEGLSSFSPSFITKNIYEASVATFSAAIEAGVKRIVFMSSMARYGRQMPPFTEELPCRPVDPYGIAKVAAEETLKVLCNTHGVKWSIAVPHNIIGVRQKYDDPMRNVASIMINRCLQGNSPIVYGDGTQKRCFSPIQDCVPSILQMINGAADGQCVNIGPDKGEITINELCQKIMIMTDFSGDIISMPDRPNEVKLAYTSSDKARKMLGYKENQSIDDCLKDMVADIKTKGTKDFDYSFPIEIKNGCPKTWAERLI